MAQAQLEGLRRAILGVSIEWPPTEDPATHPDVEASLEVPPHEGRRDPEEGGDAEVECPARQRRRSLLVADAMEGGMARETTMDVIGPLRRSKHLWRFRVVRSDDRTSHRLVSEAGEFLMYASVSVATSRVSFFQYDPGIALHSDLFDSEKPSFTMRYNTDKTEWELTQERCENCFYVLPHLSCAEQGNKQQLASIRQSSCAVGEGVSHEMQVQIPGIYSDGSPVIWCRRCRDVDLSQAVDGDGLSRCLITKRPSWNSSIECLVLEFKGRNIIPSAKNFQLSLRQKAHHVLLQYGKLSPSDFALDVGFPLSLIQAFAISMSTLFWI